MWKLYVLVAVVVLGVLEGWRTRGDTWRRSRRDWTVELLCAGLLPGAVVPLVTYAVAGALSHAAPGGRGALAWLPWPLMVGAFLLVDDLTQYLWHRLSHTSPLIWRLHRAHHAAPKMGVAVTFRNNLFYYAMMPGLWLSPVMVYLGMGEVYPWYAFFKMLVVVGAHSELRYDRVLWRHRATRPIAWILERLLSTPATHFAHHGLDATDPGTHYRGNFGNMLFVWDLLFGTAKITRIYPKSFGIEGEPEMSWPTQLVWPLAAEPHAAPPEPAVDLVEVGASERGSSPRPSGLTA